MSHTFKSRCYRFWLKVSAILERKKKQISLYELAQNEPWVLIDGQIFKENRERMTVDIAKSFNFDGVEYEIHVVNVQSKFFTVRAYRSDNKKPANGYSYMVELETVNDARVLGSSIDPLEASISTAEGDVKHGIWQEYMKAIAASEKGADEEQP